MFNRTLLKYGVFAFAITLTVFLSGCGREDSLDAGGGAPLTGVEADGETLYVSESCNGCHGADATGGSGAPPAPNIQGALPDMISAAAGAGTMADVSVTAQEAADISEFLATIETGYTYPDGETIFTAEGGCASCHGDDATGVGSAPDITSSTADEIEDAAGTDTMVDVSIRPAQAEVLVSYIATLTGGGPDGKSLFESNCGCHGAGGTGIGSAPDIRDKTAAQIKSAIESGYGAMSAISAITTDDEITAIVDYIATLP